MKRLFGVTILRLYKIYEGFGEGEDMDVFIEQLIERKSDARDVFMKMCVVIGTLLCSLFFLGIAVVFIQLQFIAFTALAAIPGVIWLGIHFFKGLTYEYEYILTNNDLDIDKIMGKRRRRRMAAFNLVNAQMLDRCTENLTFTADVTVSAHDNTYVNMWYLLIRHDSYGKVVLLFNPDDAFLSKLNKSLPFKARNKNINDKQEGDN
jgi:hypothetical protein